MAQAVGTTDGTPDLAAAILREFGTPVLLYDGECPVCREYLSLLQIRRIAGEVRPVDARARPDLVRDLRTAGYEINDGMVLVRDGGIVFGGTALSLLAQLTARPGERRGLLNRLTAGLFRRPVLGPFVYRLLTLGRRLLLRCLGRNLI